MTELKASDVIPGIIAAAVAAAGPMGNNEGAWKAKINVAIPHIASMMSDGSRQWRTALEVLEAQVFTGQYVRHETEESSTRIILYVDVGRPSDNYPDGVENIVTQRTDNAAGRGQLARIEKLEPGDELVLWRTMEPIKGTNKSRRTLVHFETRPRRTDAQQAASGPDGHAAGSPTGGGARGPGVEAPGLGASTAPTGGAPAPYTDQIDTDRLKAWRHKVRETLTNGEYHELGLTLAQHGFDFDGVSEIEWVDHVRPLVQGIINGRD